MGERDRRDFFERFDVLRWTQAELSRTGYVFEPIPKELTEARVTAPLIHRLRTTITQRGFGSVAGRVAITFSGYAADRREIYAIPEIRAYWRALDRQVPELPALLTVLPAFRYNGPGQHVLLLGTITAVRHDPTTEQYQAHVVDGPRLLADALARIRRAGRAYQLPEDYVRR